MAKAKTTKATSKKATAKKATAKKATAKKATPKKSSTKKKAATKKTSSRKQTAGETEVSVDRRAPKADRRQTELEEILNEELEAAPAPERRKVSRRRQIDPTTCERDYNNDEIEFMHALDAYKRSAGRMFPTCSEILEVVRDLGYYRLTPEQMAQLGFGGDATEDGEVTADQADGEPSDSETDDQSATIEAVSSANELSDAIRTEGDQSQISVAAVGFPTDQANADNFAASSEAEF